MLLLPAAPVPEAEIAAAEVQDGVHPEMMKEVLRKVRCRSEGFEAEVLSTAGEVGLMLALEIELGLAADVGLPEPNEDHALFFDPL